MDRRRQAIKFILSRSLDLRRILLPHLEIRDGILRDIDFNRILEDHGLTPEIRAAIIWMRALWTLKSKGYDLIELSLALDKNRRALVLGALKIMWR